MIKAIVFHQLLLNVFFFFGLSNLLATYHHLLLFCYTYIILLKMAVQQLIRPDPPVWPDPT